MAREDANHKWLVLKLDCGREVILKGRTVGEHLYNRAACKVGRSYHGDCPCGSRAPHTVIGVKEH